MAMSTDACWGGYFGVEPGILLSNRTFLCRTMHFAVELDFFVSNKVIITEYQYRLLLIQDIQTLLLFMSYDSGRIFFLPNIFC